MDYREVKEKLENIKMSLEIKLQNEHLSLAEKEALQNAISNYEYIIELADMNHYERGFYIQ